MPAHNATWQAHKAELFELAARVGAIIGQDARGKPTIRHPPSGSERSFPTWLAALSWLRSVTTDSQRTALVAAQQAPEAIPVAMPYYGPDTAPPPVQRAPQASTRRSATVTPPPRPAPETPPLIRWDCPSCGQRCKAPQACAGRRGTCPHCGLRHYVPPQ
jgi:hypothetical protein